MRVTVNNNDYQITRKLQSSSEFEEVFKYYTNLNETEHEFQVTVKSVPGEIDILGDELSDFLETELVAELKQLTAGK